MWHPAERGHSTQEPDPLRQKNKSIMLAKHKHPVHMQNNQQVWYEISSNQFTVRETVLIFISDLPGRSA